MATHDYVISNASGASVRADLNNALAAIVSNNSNATSPATTYAYQWWADTTTGQLKLRNSANSAWITIFELDGTMLMEDGTVSAPGLAFASDTEHWFLRPAQLTRLTLLLAVQSALRLAPLRLYLTTPAMMSTSAWSQTATQTCCLSMQEMIASELEQMGQHHYFRCRRIKPRTLLGLDATTINTEVTTIRATETDSYVGAYINQVRRQHKPDPYWYSTPQQIPTLLTTMMPFLLFATTEELALERRRLTARFTSILLQLVQ